MTRIVIGNCGVGIAPTPIDRRDTALCNLFEVEGMSLDALRAGVDWGFEDSGEYLEMLRRYGLTPFIVVV